MINGIPDMSADVEMDHWIRTVAYARLRDLKEKRRHECSPLLSDEMRQALERSKADVSGRLPLGVFSAEKGEYWRTDFDPDSIKPVSFKTTHALRFFLSSLADLYMTLNEGPVEAETAILLRTLMASGKIALMSATKAVLPYISLEIDEHPEDHSSDLLEIRFACGYLDFNRRLWTFYRTEKAIMLWYLSSMMVTAVEHMWEIAQRQIVKQAEANHEPPVFSSTSPWYERHRFRQRISKVALYLHSHSSFLSLVGLNALTARGIKRGDAQIIIKNVQDRFPGLDWRGEIPSYETQLALYFAVEHEAQLYVSTYLDDASAYLSLEPLFGAPHKPRDVEDVAAKYEKAKGERQAKQNRRQRVYSVITMVLSVLLIMGFVLVLWGLLERLDPATPLLADLTTPSIGIPGLLGLTLGGLITLSLLTKSLDAWSPTRRREKREKEKRRALRIEAYRSLAVPLPDDRYARTYRELAQHYLAEDFGRSRKIAMDRILDIAENLDPDPWDQLYCRTFEFQPRRWLKSAFWKYMDESGYVEKALDLLDEARQV